MGVRPAAEGYGRYKLLLFGEHAAVRGHPALGLGLEEGIKARIHARESLRGFEAPSVPPAYRDKVLATAADLARAVPGAPRGGLVELESAGPVGRGLGSSAALCVAIARAMRSAAGRAGTARRAESGAPPAEEVWALAHEAERAYHGSPSGIDTGLSALGGLVLFRAAPPGLPDWERVEAPLPALVYGSVPRLAEGREHIARLRAAPAGGPEAGALERLGAASIEAARLLRAAASGAGPAAASGPADPPAGTAGNAPAAEAAGPASMAAIAVALGELASRAQGLLAGLGLSSPALDAMIAAGLGAGALGGKLSGAGGGGAFYLVFASAEEARAALPSLEAAAARLGVEAGLALLGGGGDWRRRGLAKGGSAAGSGPTDPAFERPGALTRKSSARSGFSRFGTMMDNCRVSKPRA